MRFKGHTEANSHAGWRYGFVAAHADGTVSQYGQIFSADSAEIAYKTGDDERRFTWWLWVRQMTQSVLM